MKIWRNKFLKQMIIVITVVYLIINCIMPNYVYADKSEDGGSLNWKNILITGVGVLGTVAATIGLTVLTAGAYGIGTAIVAGVNAVGAGVKITIGALVASETTEDGIDGIPGNILEEFMDFTVAIADVIMGVLQSFMIDVNITDLMISNKDDNLGGGSSGKEPTDSWLYAGVSDKDSLSEGKATERGSALMLVEADAIKDGLYVENYEVPNILYSPEKIFANKIAALDANFINPHQYTSVREDAESAPQSLAETISPTVATWYRAFRNIAIVGLLSVLVYIGIRIVIGTVSEKAKYKERLQDWFVALCMIFVMHFIMAGIMMISEKVIDLVGDNANTGIIIAVDDGCIFRTTFTGYIRFYAQANNWKIGVGYSLMYLVLVGITIRYTFIYLKRALYLAFFTVIAPMVALTYPIDKIKDSEAQAFNIWIKEYFINAILQPMHLLLFTVLVGSTMSLAITNPIYGIVVLLFMPTAENWIKRMFKMDKAPLSATSLGDVAVLGTIFGMGKNIATGVVRGVGTTVGAVRDGGIRALSSGVYNSAVGTPFRGGNSLGKAIKNAIAGRVGDTVEDTVNRATKETKNNKITNNNITNNYYGNVDDYRNKVADENLKQDTNQEEEKERNRKKATAEINNNLSKIKSLEDAYRFTQQPIDSMNLEEYSSNENKQNNSSESSDITEKKGNSVVSNNTTKGTESENDKAEMREKTIKSITKNDAGKDVKEMINKGLGGAAGAMAGLASGAFAAGLTADNKMLIAGTLAGAHVGSSAADSLMKFGDTTYNNNIKVLVKDGITNKDIIKNTAQIAKSQNWSEDKMKMVAKMAEKYPNLEKDIDKQQELTKEFRDAGLKNDKIIKSAIRDVIKAQEGLDETNKNIKEQNKSDKNIKNWK